MARPNLTVVFFALLCSVNGVLPQPSNPFPESVPRTQDFVYLTLDQDTAHRHLLVSEDNRTATLVRERQPYPDHPDRYEEDHQVLASTGLTGRSYFEVQWHHWVDIAMTYKLMLFNSRHGYDKGVFGDNSHSWSLRIYDGQFFVCDKNVQEPVRRISTGLVGFSRGGGPLATFISGVVGVYLDYDAGILSFYEILDEGRASHLHTFRETFTQPLFPGFGVWIVYAKNSAGNSVSLVTPPRLSTENIHAGMRPVRARGPVRAEEPATLELFSFATFLIVLVFVCMFAAFPWNLVRI